MNYHFGEKPDSIPKFFAWGSMEFTMEVRIISRENWEFGESECWDLVVVDVKQRKAHTMAAVNLPWAQNSRHRFL